jgi:6-pyruvoyltetrahydropterin/6-carboxytetrahydropterin synthase
MTMQVYKEFTIEAAHQLPAAPVGHKCRRLHGHSFRIEVHVTGIVDPEHGWVIDYADIKDAFAPIHEALDHRFLNEIEGLENPTSENLCRWIWSHLHRSLPGLFRIIAHETCTTGCIYEGEGGAA